jgi:hypothetical protein
MKKIIPLLICFLLLPTASFLQDDLKEFDGEVKWSELFEISKKLSAPNIIGHDGTHVYITRTKGKKKYMETYGIRSLQLEKSVELNLTYKEKPLELIYAFMYNNSPVLYTKFYNVKTKINYTFVQTVNKSTLAASTPIVVSETAIPKTKGFGLSGGLAIARSSGSFIVSEDNSLSYSANMVYADETEERSNLEIEKISGKLYDENFKVMEESEFKLPYDQFRIVQTKLSNDGLVYIAGNEFTIEDDNDGLLKRKKTVFGDLKILILDLSTADFEVLEVSFDDRKIESFTFKLNPDGSMIVSGLISQDNGGVSGGFYAKYNAKLEQESLNFVDFEADFITQDWSERSKEKLEKKNEKEDKKGKENTKPIFFNYEIRELIVKPDGTTTLLAEQYYVRVVTTTTTSANGGTTTTTTYYYYYNDIIALNFDENGELVWKTVIDKYQISVNDGGYYSSFFTILQGNDINIVYNDRESNMVDTEGMSVAEKKKLRRNIIGKRVLLSEDGELSSEKIFEFEEGGLRLVPKVCGAVDENTTFLYARAGSGDKIGLIEW